MVVTEGPGGIGTRIIRTDYPVVEGTSLGTTKTENLDIILEPQEETLIPDKHWGSI